MIEANISLRVTRSADNIESSSSDKYLESSQAIVDNKYKFEQPSIVIPDSFFEIVYAGFGAMVTIIPFHDLETYGLIHIPWQKITVSS